MKKFMLQIQQLVTNTRREWIKEVLYNYQITSKNLWRYYGYHSPNEMKQDLKQG